MRALPIAAEISNAAILDKHVALIKKLKDAAGTYQAPRNTRKKKSSNGAAILKQLEEAKRQADELRELAKQSHDAHRRLSLGHYERTSNEVIYPSVQAALLLQQQLELAITGPDQQHNPHINRARLFAGIVKLLDAALVCSPIERTTYNLIRARQKLEKITPATLSAAYQKMNRRLLFNDLLDLRRRCRRGLMPAAG